MKYSLDQAEAYLWHEYLSLPYTITVNKLGIRNITKEATTVSIGENFGGIVLLKSKGLYILYHSSWTLSKLGKRLNLQSFSRFHLITNSNEACAGLHKLDEEEL
ncbi:unnamed protein product [Heterobilharzia americana]|nr:unnamed protein product [Heterobilharzia americana]